MTLDLNCVRDTLLTLEEWLVLDDDLDFHRLGVDQHIIICHFQKNK